MEVMWTCSSTSQAQVLPSECSFVALDGRNIMSSFFKTDQDYHLCSAICLTMLFLFGRNTWLHSNWHYFTFHKATSTMHIIQQECASPVNSVLSFVLFSTPLDLLYLWVTSLLHFSCSVYKTQYSCIGIQ